MTKVVLNIAGMHCAACAKLIKLKLDRQPGVVQSEVNDVKKQATVEFDPGKVNISALINLIHDLGYQAKEAQ